MECKGIVIKMANDSNAWFMVFKVGKKLEKLGEHKADKSPDLCCPNFYVFNNGKSYGFKQRDYNGPGTDNVHYAIYDRKMRSVATKVIMTPGWYCSGFSEDGIHILGTVGVDTATDEFTHDIYRADKKLTKVASGLKSLDQYWFLFSKQDNLVCHCKSRNPDSGELTFETAQIGSYKALYQFTDNGLLHFWNDSKGNALLQYESNKFAIATKKGTSTPTSLPGIDAQDALDVAYFHKKTLIVRRYLPSSVELMLFKFTKKGATQKGETLSFPSDLLACAAPPVCPPWALLGDMLAPLSAGADAPASLGAGDAVLASDGYYKSYIVGKHLIVFVVKSGDIYAKVYKRNLKLLGETGMTQNALVWHGCIMCWVKEGDTLKFDLYVY
jgi:hypothetical protein